MRTGPRPEKAMYAISYDKFVLSNGLEVVLHEDHTLPTVAVNVWYHVGSKDEEAGRTGFAHLFEHVMFEGSKHHNRNYFDPLQKVGSSLNGSTSADKTNYWENVPSNYLELALWLESDRMGFLLEALDQKRFDIQRDVVKNERRQSYENRPYGAAHLMLQPAIFPAPHPYNWPVIGSQEDLDSASLEDVKAFFRRYYSPSNVSLALAGDFDPSKARKLVERYFGDIPPTPPVSRVGRMDSALRGEVRLDIRDKVQLPRVYLVWPGSPMFDEEEASLDVLGALLGYGKGSRLYRSLVYDRQIARDVSVGNYSQEIAGEFHIQVTASPGHSLSEVEDVVEEELDRVRREPPDEREVQRAVNLIESHHVRQLEHAGGFGGRADQLNHYNVFAGDPGVINTDLDRYKAVGPSDVVRVANSFLQADRVRLSVLPEEPATVSEGSIDRSVTPKAATHREYSPPVPVRHRLSNGLDILHVEKRGLPLVGVGLVVPAGATSDPADAPGLAHMTAALLTEGTASLSSVQISDEMELMGSYLDSSASREHMTLSAETLTAHWPRALEIMADVARNATFPPRELERVRNEHLADLRRIGDDPVTIAGRAARGLVFGPETRYGHPVSGTVGSVEALSRESLVGYFQRTYVPRGATLIVVGDVTGSEVISRAESLLGDWDGSSSEAREEGPPDEVPVDGTTIFLADKPGAAQSVIRAAQVTVPRGHPDFYALTLVNYVFGGQATARLFMNLRQDKGYSYGYYSSIDWGRASSAIFAGGAVETSVTKESVAETLKEFADIRGARPVSRSEFNAARDGIFRGFPALFETQGQMVSQLIRIALFDLPDDYYANFVDNMRSVTLKDLRAVASERIDDQHLVVLVVGDRKAIEPGLTELGLSIVPVDYDGHRLE